MTKLKLTTIFFFSFLSLISSSFAGDSYKGYCSGLGVLTFSSGGYDWKTLQKMSVLIYNRRAADGESRVLSVVIDHDGKSYKGEVTALDFPAQIKATLSDDPNNWLFDGAIEQIENDGLVLSGKFLVNKDDKEASNLNAILKCDEVTSNRPFPR